MSQSVIAKNKFTGAVTAGAIAAGALAAAGLGSAPAANASCISAFGIGNSATCTSNLTSIAVAIGNGAQAYATGKFGAAFSIGTSAKAVTAAGGLFNVAATIGPSSGATAGGIFSVAAAAGSGGAAEAGAGPAPTHIGNIAVNIGKHSNTNGASADGIANLSVNLFGDSFGEAIGVGNTSFAVGGSGTILAAIGYFNNVTNISGNNGDIEADGGNPTVPAFGSVAFNAFGSGNAVYAGPGPLAIAGSLFQTKQTVKKVGPGIAINNFRIGGAASVPVKSAARSAAAARAATSKPAAPAAAASKGSKP